MKWFFCAVFLSFFSSGCHAAPSDSQPSPVEPVEGTFEVPTPKPTASPTPTALPSPPKGVLRLPAAPTRRVVRDAQIDAIKNKLKRYPTSAGYRRLAERSLQLQMFPEAVLAFRAEAAIYHKKGLNDAALIVENKAARYETQLQLFGERAPTWGEWKKLHSKARLEPKIGIYIGAFIDRDDRLKEIFRGVNYQIHRHPQEFAQLVGKPHATHFTYVAYGNPAPRAWLEMCKREKVIPHIAWEPKNLKEVKDDKYLQDFAKALRDLDWPVFIRFAGEMNGFWTPYHKDPILYRAKFRLVHQVLHRHAPRVATIWCVNSVPSQTIPNYYPGDDGCDWVGVNFYNAPFYDNDPRRSALLDNPLSLLDPVYKRYAARKPIAICEYGASHMAAVDRKLRNEFAIEKMSLLYGALPLLYPRVKMINWFDSDNLKHAKAGRQLNNYSLTEQEKILAAYKKQIEKPYFLGEVPDHVLNGDKNSTGLAVASFPIRGNEVMTASSQWNIWVKTYVARPKVFLAIGKKIIYAGQGNGAHSLDIARPQEKRDAKAASDSSSNSNKKPVAARLQKTTLTAFVFDEENRFIHSLEIPISANGSIVAAF